MGKTAKLLASRLTRSGNRLIKLSGCATDLHSQDSRMMALVGRLTC